jgi:transposase
MTQTFYCGVDFHARSQTIAYCDSTTREVQVTQLDHRADDLRQFYSQLPGKVIVGLETCGYSRWFEQLLDELGCEVWIGHASEVRRFAKRRQKNDRRDAELILDLLLKGNFPRIQRRDLASTEFLRQLRYRHRLVRMATMIKNSLQALAMGSGLSERVNLSSRGGKQRLLAAPMSEVQRQQRRQWLDLLDVLDKRIGEVEGWLAKQAKADERAMRLQTHPGIGLMTAMCLVHTLEPVSRFANQRKVVAYAGLEPMERSSGEKKRYQGISKEGPKLLRYLVGEAAQTAARADGELQRMYKRLVVRRGLGRAKVAVGRKLLVRSYIMLRDGIDYEEFLRRGVEARLARNAARRKVPEM